MGAPIQLVVLTDDNWADYLTLRRPNLIVKGRTIGPAGIDCNGPEVDALLAWLAEQSEKYLTKRFTISRHDAATVLESAAGWDPKRPT